jgi:hypothetical protein
MKSSSGAKAKRILKYAGAGLGVLFLIACAWAAFLALRPDAPPFDDSALMPNRPSVPDEQNGYVALVHALRDIKYAESLQYDAFRKLSDRDIHHLEKKYQRQILDVNETLNYSKSQYIPDGGTKQKVLFAAKYLAYLQTDLAQREFRIGKQAAAINRVQWSLNIAKILLNSRGDRHHLMTGLNIAFNSLQTINGIVTSNPVHRKGIDSFAYMISKCPVDNAQWVHAIQQDYVQSVPDSDTGLYIEEFAYRAFLKSNIIHQQLSSVYIDALHLADEPHLSNTENKIQEAIDNACKEFNGHFFILHSVLDPNRAYSDILKCKFISHYLYEAKVYFILSSSMRMTQVKLAVLAYRMDHGELPRKLDALVPEYLDAIPSDPFTGKPLLYDAKKGVIYSAGFDSTDNGGEAGLFILEGDYSPNDFREQKDLVLKIDGPVKKERAKAKKRIPGKEKD